MTKSCPVCSFDNHPEVGYCEICHTELKTNAGREVKRPVAHKVVTCSGCTYDNPIDAVRCEVCLKGLEDICVLSDRMAALALQHAQMQDEMLVHRDRAYAERLSAEQESKELEGAPHVYKCPRCGCPTSILPSEVNCTIFICGAIKSYTPGASTQLPQHNEALAAEVSSSGKLVSGTCGGQYRLDAATGVLVPCTGR